MVRFRLLEARPNYKPKLGKPALCKKAAWSESAEFTQTLDSNQVLGSTAHDTSECLSTFATPTLHSHNSALCSIVASIVFCSNQEGDKRHQDRRVGIHGACSEDQPARQSASTRDIPLLFRYSICLVSIFTCHHDWPRRSRL